MATSTAVPSIYRVNDWAFVAAESLEQAKQWYRDQDFGDEIDEDWTEEVSRDTAFNDPDENPEIETLGGMAEKALASGKSLPFQVAVDRSYC